MHFFGESRSRAHAPADKPRDAEAMDAAAAIQVDAQDAKRRAEAGTKFKPSELNAPESRASIEDHAISNNKRNALSFGGGALVGTLGGLIGLGGAEFRLPLLIGLFEFVALEAVVLNKAMSLVVVASALVFRAGTIPFAAIGASWPIIVNLLAGSLVGAWVGASWATRLRAASLCRVIAGLLVVIALVLVFGHGGTADTALVTGAAQIAAGVVAGFAIGVVASLLGVAGGELLIPTLILLFGADIKLAGSLSLAVSLPTMLVGFARYSRDRSFSAISRNKVFLLVMAAGSMAGTFIGGKLLGIVPEGLLLPTLAAILLFSAWKVWHHK